MRRIASEYTPDWPAVARQIKEAAGWCCEHCTQPHDPPAGYTLTVHHLDGDKRNNDPRNLVALCQRCHLRIQAHFLPGQLWLPGLPRPAWMVARRLGV